MPNASLSMFAIMINKLKKRLDNANIELLKRYGLRKLHLLYLMVLFEKKEGMTLKELSNYLGFDKANTSRAISQLTSKGYVQKKAQGELELKYKVELTEKGHDVATIIWQENQAANAELIKMFSSEELLLLSQIGAKLWNYLSDESHEKSEL